MAKKVEQEHFEHTVGQLDSALYSYSSALTDQERIQTAGEIYDCINLLQHIGGPKSIDDFTKTLTQKRRLDLDAALELAAQKEWPEFSISQEQINTDLGITKDSKRNPTLRQYLDSLES